MNAPCRVSADLTTHELAQRAGEPTTFDPHDDALMHDAIGGGRLVAPVQALLVSLDEIEKVHGSFGADCLNKARLLDALLPELRALREAVLDEARDL